MIEQLASPEIWFSLLTLTILEIVLGIDNIIFLAIVSSRLPKRRQPHARKIGLAMALIGRIIFLCSMTAIIALKDPIANIWGFELSWRDVVLFMGGMFLVYKATIEIHASVEGDEDHDGKPDEYISFGAAIAQIAALDVVFALDSMITAVGLSSVLWVMITANVIAMIIMLVASGVVSEFIDKHPTIKMLALSFLFLVGTVLVADAFHYHIPRGYIYFSIAFSIITETLNIITHKKKVKKQAKKSGTA